MDTFEKLEEKISRAVAFIDKLTEDKKALVKENDQLKKQLVDLQAQVTKLEELNTDRSEKVKERLSGILGKLNLLEQI